MNDPSPAQMRALQLLREGKLIWKAARPGLFDITIETPDRGWNLAPVTARKLVDNQWVELRKFTARQGEYRLTKAARALTDELCRHRIPDSKLQISDVALLSGMSPDATTAKHDWASERLLCRKCWRVMPCAGKFFKQRHGANRLHWRLGPVCQKHFGIQ